VKKIIAISSVFIGLVIGAGFASGREILEYFCIPSRTDFTGIILAGASFGAVCYIIMDLSKKSKSANFDKLIDILSGKLAPFIKIFMMAFMFCGFFVMMSASGVLSEETLGMPPQFGIWTLAAVCFLVFSFDVRGIVAFNTVLVPLMLSGMVYICLSAGLAALPVFSVFETAKNSPHISALCYVSYNTITAGAVLVPLSQNASRKQIISSSVVSSAVLSMVIFLAWLCMSRFFDGLFRSEMPLLEMASRDGDAVKKMYTAVLFMALCTTAVSHGFGILSKFTFRKPIHRIAASAVLCLSAIPFANLGFSQLVSVLYSAFGYVGFLWTALLIYKYLRS